MRKAVEQVKALVMSTAADLASLEERPFVEISETCDDLENEVVHFIRTDDVGPNSGVLTAQGLRRWRQIAEQLAHAINRHAPQGVLWAPRFYFFTRERDDYADVVIRWGVVIDDRAHHRRKSKRHA